MAGSIFQIIALLTVATRFAVAAPAPAFVTILNPAGVGLEPHITASIEGVDSEGRTTYAFTESGQGFTDAATFVEASDYFSRTDVATFDFTTQATGEVCMLEGSNGACTLVVGDFTEAITQSAFTVVFDVPAPTDKPNSSQRTSTSVFGALLSVSLAYHLI
ncbi:hypothetical protein C8R44DRAFT_981598 [Mycena epipterygia]|nr:hypothetical protein C8R44DRAFT_981598 [Mycena epipterygia]